MFGSLDTASEESGTSRDIAFVFLHSLPESDQSNFRTNARKSVVVCVIIYDKKNLTALKGVYVYVVTECPKKYVVHDKRRVSKSQSLDLGTGVDRNGVASVNGRLE